MLKSHCNIQLGFSLTDLLLGSAIGLLVLTGAIGIYTGIATTSSIHLSQAQLNAELRATLSVITRNLRRAGYWAGKPGIDGITNNPFMFEENNLQVGTVAGEAANSCITFSYDRNKDKLVGVGKKGRQTLTTNRNNVEQVGYRIHKGAVESRISGAGLDCNSGRWQDLTSPNIRLTSLQFTLHRNRTNLSNAGEPCAIHDFCQTSRLVELSLSGQLKNRTQTQRTMHTSVQLRNDRLVQITD